MQSKDLIRKQILKQRSELTAYAVLEANDNAFDKLSGLEVYSKASLVMLYMDFRNEVPTRKIISEVLSSGKRLVLPLTDKDFNIIPYEISPRNGDISAFLKVSPYGISEPDPELCAVVDPCDIDLIIIPGVAFDKSGNRIGYGKGCYDRFLPLLRQNAYKLALAYNFQVLDNVPANSADILMDKILTV